MSKPNKPAALAVCTALAGGIALTGTAFAMQPLAQGYMLGAPSNSSPQADKKAEGKCGVAKFDTDGDGRISRAEFEAAHPGKGEKFDGMDSNGDGYVDEAEHAAHKAANKGKEGKCGGDKKHAEGKCGGAA